MRKKIIAGLIVMSFILLVVGFIFYLQKTRELWQLDPLELEEMTKEDILQTIYERHEKRSMFSPFLYLIPIFGFFGVVVGASVYYILTNDMEKKDEAIKTGNETILKLLNPEERKIIKKIVEEGGKVQQMELTYLEGFTKVKAHRITESLESKGIISKEKLGKQRLIRLNKEFLELLN